MLPASKVQWEEERYAGRLSRLVIHRRREVDGLFVSIRPPIVRPVSIPSAITTPFRLPIIPVSVVQVTRTILVVMLVVITMPSTIRAVVSVVMIACYRGRSG